MSALQFLNKKSWHTSTIRNNEKVWLAEQAAAKEKARVAELQKQLEEERKLEEIQRLEIESGRLDPAEVLKRRRLNWMYEHDPADKDVERPDLKKRRLDKDRDDVLLGKKEVDLDDEAKKKEEAERAFLRDAEAKIRADPMTQVAKEMALAEQLLSKTRSRTAPRQETLIPAHNAPTNKYTPAELAAKKVRKEERRQIREARRLKKEEKEMRKRLRAQQYETKFVEVDVQPNDDKKEAKLFSTDPRSCCDERGEHSQTKTDRYRSSSPRRDSAAISEGLKYGLHIPKSGTGVAVTKEFTPRNRSELVNSKHDNAGCRSPVRDRRPKSEGARRPPLSPVLRDRAEEKRRLLKEMKEDALRLEDQRRVRAQKHVLDANREREDLDERFRQRKSNLSAWKNEPAATFARETISGNRSTADRIRQRRAWATNNSNAQY